MHDDDLRVGIPTPEQCEQFVVGRCFMTAVTGFGGAC